MFTANGPALLVTAEDSPPAFAGATAALASAIPSARVARAAGGHLIDPAGPAVLAFVDEVSPRLRSAFRNPGLSRTCEGLRHDGGDSSGR